MIAFLGMGLLGSNFVRALLKKGETVQVWNRTTLKATELEKYGAKAFPTAADAVKGAKIIHLTLKDDATVNEVLANVQASLEPGAIIIDHTTTTVEGSIQRTAEWKQRGFTYLHVPVFMGPANALESSGFMLVSGDQAVIASLQPSLEKMTGKLLHFGDQPGRAIGIKLLGNTFLVGFAGGLADTLSLAEALQVPSSDLATLFSSWNPGSTLTNRLKRMSSGDYSNPSWELNMARKDVGIFLQSAEKAGTPLVVIPSIAIEMDRWIAKGHGNEDWTVIGSQYTSKPTE